MQVIDGAAVVGTSDRHAVGGAMLDDLLQARLLKDGISMSQQDLQALKEKCALAADSREEYVEALEDNKEIDTVQHTLPDGQVVTIGKERYAKVDHLGSQSCHC